MPETASVRLIGRSLALLGGPIVGLAAAIALGSVNLEWPARITAGLTVWMATWWIAEAVPLAITSLLPIIVLPLAGVMSTRQAAAPFAHEIIFLFLGGFILGLSLEKWNAHKRIALGIIRLVGFGPKQVVAGFMIASALLSMFISNTATVIMLLPIAASVITLIQRSLTAQGSEHDGRNFAISLLLGVAYASSVGGVATINGTPPNGILVAFLSSDLGVKVSYAQWMKFGLPLTAIMLPLVWWVLVYLVFPIRVKPSPEIAKHLKDSMRDLGPMTRGEKTVFIVFGLTALTWIFKSTIANAIGMQGDLLLSDTGVALIGAVALFAIPVNLRRGVFAMDWETAQTLPWGVLILFGGGLSLAGAVQHTGLDQAIGTAIGGIGPLPPLLTLLVVAFGVIFLTELTSNTAVTSALLPVLAAAALSLGVSPVAICIVAGSAASYAFMLPVGTPPNAIVFGTGHVRIAQMARAGLLLNLASAFLIVSVMAIVGTRVFGLSLDAAP